MPAIIKKPQQHGSDAMGMGSLFSPEGGRDTVYLERDGARSEALQCNFSSPKTALFYRSLDITEGDKLIRPTPGREDVYTIVEVTYSPGLGGIPPHYSLQLTKDSAIKPRSGSTNTINIHNSHGIQIGDNNVQNFEVFVRDMVRSIDQSDASPDERKEAKGRLRAFLEHPLVSAGFGAALPAILGLLG